MQSSAADRVVPAPVPRTGIACLCAGVSLAEVDEVLAGDPACTVRKLGEVLGCGIQCGSCIPVLRAAVGEQAWFPASAACRPITTAREQRGMDRLIYKVDITLRDPHGYPAAKPGQHIVLRADTGQGIVERTYTVVAQDVAAGHLTVGIRRKPDGRLTPWLLQSFESTGPRAIEVSVPAGPGLHASGAKSVVFFAGGVGVTPAVAMAGALSQNASMHLDYTVEHAGDAAFVPKFEARSKERSGFSFQVRETSVTGPITRKDVAALVERFRGSRFFLCGPQGYVDFVHRALRQCKVEPARIHIELFALASTRAPARSFRYKAYVAGIALAAAPMLLLTQPLEPSRPHGHPNIGHERLQCVACHVASPGSMRQVFQAKVKHALGWRQTGAVLGMQPVTSATCVQCHANADDRHPTHRFLEPRFAEARAAIAPQVCVSCHREHSATRFTAANAGYCVNCHKDLQVKDDRTSPTHDFLVRTNQWATCLQCHDYHGNHKWTAPLRLQDGNTLEALNRYLKDGPSPYGETIVKAREQAP